MLSRLTELVQSFDGRRVLLVGDLILDRYIYGDAERISPEAPVLVLRRQQEEERVGGAGSVAANLRALGLQVKCFGAVGADESGERLRRLLMDQGIETGGILGLGDRRTTAKTRFIGLAQHRHRQQLMRVDDELRQSLSERDEEDLLAAIKDALAVVDVVCLEDYDKGLLTPRLCERVIKASSGAGKPVLVDPAKVADYSKYQGATMLTPNRAEFCLAAGCEESTLEVIRKHAGGVMDRFGLGGLLVTLDRDGSLLALRGSELIEVPTRPRSVYDNTGAGDAVLAMLAAAVAAGATWEEAAKLTNIAGGLEVEKFGCVPVRSDEVIADLRLAAGTSSVKIREADDLMAELVLRRSRGQMIVFTNGCFDLLHAGHVQYLESCREHGHVVVVGLNSDASVRAQDKGGNRPIVPQQQRAEVLAALQVVDYVVIFDEPTPKEIIEKLSPDVLIKGEDWADRGVVGREHVESTGGKVVLLPLVPGWSTSGLIDRIRSGQG